MKRARHLLYSVVVICLAAMLSLSASAGFVNPAIERFRENITFYVNFDTPDLSAAIGKGAVQPATIHGEVQLQDGKYGQALLVGKDTDFALSYFSGHNLDFTSPGALSLWLSPVAWEREKTKRGRFFIVRGTRGYIEFHRWASMIGRNRDRLRDMIWVFAYDFPGTGNIALRSDAGSLQDGQWHHLVLNWDESGIEMFVNGRLNQRGDLDRPLNEADFPPDRETEIVFGGKGTDNTLLDEFVVFNRTLSEAEIMQIFEIGVGVEYVLNEALDALPENAAMADADKVRLVEGRSPGTQALLLENDANLKWDVSADGNYFIEFWLQPANWDGLSGSEETICLFTIGTVQYRLYKGAQDAYLLLQAAGEIIARFPVYRWREQPWMGRNPAVRSRHSSLWHYINVVVEQQELRLTVDGFHAELRAEPKTAGTLHDFELTGSSGNTFSELRIVRGHIKFADLRARYRHLYQGRPVALLRVHVEPEPVGEVDWDEID